MKALFAIPRHYTLPILDCAIYMAGSEGGSFHATDLESNVTVFCDVPGLPEGTLINRKWLSVIYAQSKTLAYRDGKLNGIEIPDTGMKAQDFPLNGGLLAFDKKAMLQIAAANLQGVALASAKQEIRYYLNGALVDYDGSRIAACDGHRLHVQTGLSATGTGAVIVPNGAIDLILKAAAKDGQIWIDYDSDLNGAAWLRLSTHNTVIHCRPIDGKFPDIDKVIPNYGATSATIKIDGKQGAKDIRKYSQLARSTGNKNGGCCFKHKELNGSLSLPVESVSMEGIESVGVKAAYMIDALTFLDEQQSTFRGIDHNCSLEARNGNRTAVVMPMRL